MRVLEIVHGFPPSAQGGAEIYAWAHARGLLEQGDEVTVLTREAIASRAEYSVREDVQDGLRVVRVNNTFAATRRFEDTYRNDAIGAIARDLIDSWRPDVAHIHHLTCLSTTIPATLAARGIPVFHTLHDYWLMCHRGQLLDTAFRVCDGPGVSGCAACLGVAGSVPASALAAAGALRQIERRLPAVLGEPLGRASRRLAAGLATEGAAARESKARADHMREVCSHVTRFLAPSAHMRDRFVGFGVPASRIVVSGYGFDARPFRGLVRTAAPHLRIGFLGSLMVSKAPHVLLEAFALLPRGAATVTLYGAPVAYHGDNSYRQALVPLLARSGVRLAGPIAHQAVARTLADLDVLVVPSIWPENSPLVIREAFLAGVPVVASRIGGILELVQDGVNGLLFEAGNAEDLRRVLQRFIDEPALLSALRSGMPPVRTIEDDVRQTRTFYEQALAAKPAQRPAAPRVAAIVLNYKTPDETRLAVVTLLASKRPLDEIIVVDNDDPGACRAALNGLSGVVTCVEAGTNLGFSGGMNVGIREALRRRADAVLLVNSDAIVSPDCVEALERCLRADDRRGIAGPLLRSRSDPDVVASAGMTYTQGSGRMRHRQSGERIEHGHAGEASAVDGVSGCVMLIRRKVIDEVGLLDEDYFFSFEDLEFCLRAKRAGYSTWIEPAATAFHEGGRSIGPASPQRLYFAARNHLLMAERIAPKGGVLRSAPRSAYIVALNLTHAALSPGASLAERLRSVLDGVRDFRGGRFGGRK